MRSAGSTEREREREIARATEGGREGEGGRESESNRQEHKVVTLVHTDRRQAYKFQVPGQIGIGSLCMFLRLPNQWSDPTSIASASELNTLMQTPQPLTPKPSNLHTKVSALMTCRPAASRMPQASLKGLRVRLH